MGKWPDVNKYLKWSPPKRSADFGGTVMDPTFGPPGGGGSGASGALAGAGDVEIVIVRPNIEHYMMGIILGQGGDGLGQTFWGQTELSCYDDSMHGIWGMSYKYNSRAIVLDNSKLLRLWDVAYDSYTGGKNDTYVDWDNNDPSVLNSQGALMEYTNQVARHYRGPSMLVMAFHHGPAKANRTFTDHFKPNWPSPIVFHDNIDRPASVGTVLPTDYENLHQVDTEEFRVFNRMYAEAYREYFAKMPDFTQLHHVRKNAGQATHENEVASDSLAFQGTMRVLTEDGRIIEDIHGSGHHGVDFVGVASVRNGKGYKIASQPEIRRMV